MTKAEGQVLLAGAILVCGGLVFGYWNDVFKPMLGMDDDDVKVYVQVLSGEPCDPDRPVLVGVRNDARRTIKSIAMSIELYERGNSAPVGSNDFDWTFIVKPGALYRACLPMGRERPTGGHDENYRAMLARKKVTFYGASEAIP
jgi:hypothetical protein